MRVLGALLVIICFCHCGKDVPDPVEMSVPLATFYPGEFVADQCEIQLSGRFTGYVEDDLPSEYGFVYSEEVQNPTVEDNILLISDPFLDNEDFSAVLTDFNSGDLVNVRLYAKAPSGIYYGNQVEKIQTFWINQSRNVRPIIEDCGMTSSTIKYKVPVACAPLGFEYGIVYALNRTTVTIDYDYIKKGTYQGGEFLEFESNIQEEAADRNVYGWYMIDPENGLPSNGTLHYIEEVGRFAETQQLNNFPGALRGESTSFVIDGQGYLCGGYTENQEELLNDLWRYSPEMDTWDEMASFPGTARALMTSFVIDGKAYVGTGGSSKNNAVEGKADFYKYDPETDAWSEIAPYPHEGLSGLSFAIDDKGYTGGLAAAGVAEHQEFYQYDPTGDTWSAIAPFPVAFLNARNASLTHNGKGYVVTNTNNFRFVAYDPMNDAWEVEELSTRLNGEDGLAFSKDGKIYQITGREAFNILEIDFEESLRNVICLEAGVVRSEAVGFNIDGSFYIVTGIEHNPDAAISANPLSSVYKIKID